MLCQPGVIWPALFQHARQFSQIQDVNIHFNCSLPQITILSGFELNINWSILVLNLQKRPLGRNDRVACESRCFSKGYFKPTLKLTWQTKAALLSAFIEENCNHYFIQSDDLWLPYLCKKVCNNILLSHVLVELALSCAEMFSQLLKQIHSRRVLWSTTQENPNVLRL